MQESVWFKKIEIQVNNQKERLHKKDFKFFHVDTFLKDAKKIDAFSTDCPECLKLKSIAEEIASGFPEYINGTVGSRKVYENMLGEISGHLQKKHQEHPDGYFISLYTFIGMFAGLTAGVLFTRIIFGNWIKEGLFIGAFIGTLVGRIYGKITENKAKINRQS